RMTDLATNERFEEAGLLRDRIRSLAESLARARTDRWLLRAGWLVLRSRQTGELLTFAGGALVRDGDHQPIPHPPPRDRADEVAAARSWISRNPVVVEDAAFPPAEPVDGGGQLHNLLARLRDAAKPIDDHAPLSPRTR